MKVSSLFRCVASTMTTAPKLIVVSNRLPFVIGKDEKTGKLKRMSSAGGLVTAVAPVVVAGQGLWVGWAGHGYNGSETIPESQADDATPTAGLRSSKVVPVIIDKDMFNSYYNGCCNGTFWPLFHSMPDRAIFCADHWKAYTSVNQIFGTETLKALTQLQKTEPSGETPLIWLHDYHLMLAATTIRNDCDPTIKYKLGFFMHIPFPPWDIFRLFPWADEVLMGMLGCDMVGFHTEDYCINFVDCCNRRLGCRVDRQNLLVEHGGRTVSIRPLPIGIPYDRFQDLASKAPPIIESNLKVILGVDRLDYTKGLPQRLKIFEKLLEKHPQFIAKVVMLQIAVPSRTDVKEYQDLKEEMDQLVGRINGRFTTPNWSPIRYIYGAVSQEELAAFYRDSSVAFITPLRDGMNLVAKEFVACQIKDPGVLIVSPFAGAGETMHEALICNPYEVEDAAAILLRGLTMPEDERTLRMNYLKRREKSQDVNHWMKNFLKAMGTVAEDDSSDFKPIQMQPVTVDDFDQYFSKYITEDQKLALLLDYDGTLAPIAPHPDLATLPEETKLLLQRLSNSPDVHISIVSGRNVKNVKEMVGVDNITYAGSHGLEILHPDGSRFVHPMPQEFEAKAKELLKVLQDQVCRDGAWVENKGVYLTFHYRETQVDLRPELVSRANALIVEHGFLPSHAHAALEAKPPIDWNKGRASIYILRTAFGLDWSERIRIIYVGDDVTDEDAMQALKGMAVTFRVTQSQAVKTAADRRLPGTDAVVMLLKWVERKFNKGTPLSHT